MYLVILKYFLKYNSYYNGCYIILFKMLFFLNKESYMIYLKSLISLVMFSLQEKGLFDFIFLVFLSLFFCYLSFMSLDPLKSSLCLIFSMIFSLGYYSCFFFVWMFYFISLLFLSGILVVLVYISGLSKFQYFFNMSFFLYFFSFFLFIFFLNFYFFGFYYIYNFFFYFFFFIFLVIIFFLGFFVFFLNFFGSLRVF